MHLSETTNGKLAAVAAEIEELIGWADADAEHAAENDAPGTAADDRRRARNLRKALALIQTCER
jgi:hypothetical protein